VREQRTDVIFYYAFDEDIKENARPDDGTVHPTQSTCDDHLAGTEEEDVDFIFCSMIVLLWIKDGHTAIM
jgi:hypothetical protein